MKMNKYFKKIMTSLMVLVTLFSTFMSNISVNAAENGMPDSITISNRHDVQYIYGSMSGGHITTIIKTISAGGYVYCIEAEKKTLENETLTFDGELTDPGYVYLAKNGFPSKKVIGEYGDNENYYVTQLAHWMYSYIVRGAGNGKVDGYLIDKNGNQLHNFNGGDNANLKQTKLADAAYKLFKGAWNAHKAGTASTEVSLTVGSVNKTLNKAEGYLISDKATVTLKNASTYTVTVDTNNATVIDNEGNEKNTFNSGESFQVKVNGYDTVNVKVSIETNGTVDKVYKYKPYSTSKQATMYSVVKSTKVTKKANLEFNYENNNVVEISKADATTGKEVAGASLELYDSNNTLVEKWTSTTESHKIKLNPGTYRLVETNAPDGYILSKEEVTFTVKEDGSCDKVIMKNQAIPEIEISKADATTGKEVAGAHLELYDSNNTLVEKWTSTNKVHKVKLLPGTYRLTETIAPDGYILSKEEVTFTVTLNGVNEKVVMKNTPVGETLISKVDATNSKELPGAHLVITDSNGEVVEEWISTENAHGVKLMPGTYTLTETIAPEGYVLSKEEITFTVKDDGTTDKVTMKNAPVPETEVSKVDATTGKELPGAHLEIRDEKGALKDSWVSTNEIHKVKLLPGTYTLKETIAPNDYILSTEEVTFTVKDDGTVTKVEMKNTPIRVTEVEISKIDVTTGKELPGAHLELTDSEGNVIDSWISTNEVHKVKLHDGVYSLTETIAPEGYELSTESITFEISENTVVRRIVMDNKPYIPVPVTDLNASSMSIILGSMITLFGFGMFFYHIKKEN